MKINKIFLTLLSGSLLMGFQGCNDDLVSEITSLETTRLFSPLDLEARVVNQTGVRLNWKAVRNASSYTIEIYDNLEFEGQPVRVISDVQSNQLPYTVSGLPGETEYAVRVRAVGNEISESKWITTIFETGSEQIFNLVDPENITAKSVVLTWPAGEIATTITLAPGNITHTLTPQEIQAGSALIEGLIPETNYTAKLLNGTKTRGTITFQTGIDIGDAILINSAEELKTALSNAVGGESFALLGGDYVYAATDPANPVNLSVAKSVSIVAARASDKPVLKNVSFSIEQGAALTLKDLIVDGDNKASNLVVYGTGTYGDLKIEGCVARNFKSGIIYNNTNTAPYCTVSSILINNNIFHTFGTSGEFIDFRYGYPKALSFTNNTVYGQSERDFIRIDAAPTGMTYPSSKIVITVSNNTLYGIANFASSRRRIFYVRTPNVNHEIIFTKNIVTNTTALLAETAIPNLATVSQNYYYEITNIQSNASFSNARLDANGTVVNPGFASPSTGNFTVSNEDLKFYGIGDPRWR